MLLTWWCDSGSVELIAVGYLCDIYFMFRVCALLLVLFIGFVVLFIIDEGYLCLVVGGGCCSTT